MIWREDDGSRRGLTRRELLAGAAGAGWLCGVRSLRADTSPSLAAKETRTAFRIIWKGSKVGSHRVSFSSNGEEVTVTTSIRMTVKIAFVTAFRFEHDSRELFRAGQLQELDASTDNGGDELRVTGRATVNGFEMDGPGGPFTAPASALTTNSIWSPAFVKQSEIIDVQNGGMIGLVAKRVGEEKLKIGNTSVAAQNFELVTPYLSGRIWYGADDRWLKGMFEWQAEQIHYDLEA